MKVTFFSNYLSHHQLPFCLAMQKLLGNNFTFVSTEPIKEERLSFGWREETDAKYPFVLLAYENDEKNKRAHQLCEDSDVIIHGSAPKDFLDIGIKYKKLIFRYSERIYKNGRSCLLNPKRLLGLIYHHGKYFGKKVYLLCASAYTAGDVALSGAYLGKTYKWGYFPEVEKYHNINDIIIRKKKHSMIWVARFIDWKHPESAVFVAERLREEGYDFRLTMVGNGAMYEEVQDMIKKKRLEDYVQMTGAVPQDEVRKYMEEAEIFIFTSDSNEGWGAVLNEAMNSGCACVASNMIGAAPFLIEDGINGYMYKDGDIEDLYEKVKFLIDNPEKRAEIGAAAYKTMTEQWNAENAAERFITLAQAILDGNKRPNLFKNGVCSKAEIIDDRK